MPSVKQKRSHLKHKKETPETVVEREEQVGSKRRPSQVESQDMSQEEVVAVKIKVDSSAQEDLQTSFQSQGEGGANSTQQDSFDFGGDSSGPERIKIRFPGDTIVKRSFPKTFQLTEEIVNGWAQGGQFESLPIQNPFVRYAAKVGLKKAKQMETKVLESPVTEKVITKVFEAGLKAQSTIEEIRQKLNLNR